MRSPVMYVIAGAAGTVVAGLIGVAATLYSGWYDISATDQHLQPTYWLLEKGMHYSVKRRTSWVTVPELKNPERGYSLFHAHCVQCHGGPGVAPAPYAMGMMPAPVSLTYTAREWDAGALFWVIREGIKMTGMPAWKHRMSDEDMWAIVAFMKQKLPTLTPTEYQALKPAPHDHRNQEPAGVPNPERGRLAFDQYVCVTCHQIPGVVGAHAPVGPPLAGMGSRKFIAGLLPNTRENMVRWLRNPQAIDPGTAMPDLGITERDAVDMAAYLATLK